METCEGAAGRASRLAEGLEERAIRAAGLLRDQQLVKPILMGAAAAFGGGGRARRRAHGHRRPRSRDRFRSAAYAAAYHELRKHKGVTAEAAAAKARLPHYFGASMVRAGAAEGMVSGLNSETKPFLPAFEIVKMADGFSRASSLFVMSWPDKTLFYADCSVNIAPDAETLAEIGRATAATVRAFGHEPRLAYLSFSTRDSAQHESVERVKKAVALARSRSPALVVDGEIQFDAAYLPAVAKKKAPDSPFVETAANVFLFPDLNAGNIAYKITERLAGPRPSARSCRACASP